MQLYYTEESKADTVMQNKPKKAMEKGFCFILDGLDEYCPESIKEYIYL